MKKTVLFCAALVTPSLIFASSEMNLNEIQSSAYYQHEQAELARWTMAGIYFDANVGYGGFYIKNSGLSTSQLTGFTWNGSTGYQFNRYFALEGGYTEISGTKIMAGTTISNRNFSAVDLLAKLIFPFSQQFNMYGKLGAMYAKNTTAVSGTNTTSSDSKLVPAFGAGMGYYLTPNFALNLQGIITLASEHGIVPVTVAAYVGVSYKIKT